MWMIAIILQGQLFLSNEAEDVRYALVCGVAAATLVSSKGGGTDSDLLRFAFDGDAVLFSDEAERVYKSEGLEAFTASEKAAAREPLEIISDHHRVNSLAVLMHHVVHRLGGPTGRACKVTLTLCDHIGVNGTGLVSGRGVE